MFGIENEREYNNCSIDDEDCDEQPKSCCKNWEINEPRIDFIEHIEKY